jgi:hypothetical protein
MMATLDENVWRLVGHRLQHSTHQLANLKIPKASNKTLMKNIHQNVIKYSTYLVLNKRELENKHVTISPP